MNKPDDNSLGFLDHIPEPNRYENSSVDPDNVGAKLSALISRGAKVLDVGCGTGSVSVIIETLAGVRLTGIEPDAHRAKSARDRGLNVFQGFLTKEFLHENGPFDTIVFADVLEHLPNPAEVVALAKEGLVPGGSIVASVPNIAHWFVRLDLLFGRFNYQDCGIMDATHLRWFTKRTIKEFFERTGFSITGEDHTVNIELPDYRKRIPWRWVPLHYLRKSVGLLAYFFPRIFGCQHIIRATLSNSRHGK